MKYFSSQDILKELERELKMREKMYPAQIARNKLHRNTANKRFLIIRKLKAFIELAHNKVFTLHEPEEILNTYSPKKELQQKPDLK